MLRRNRNEVGLERILHGHLLPLVAVGWCWARCEALTDAAHSELVGGSSSRISVVRKGLT
jgi:hypothetical protein